MDAEELFRSIVGPKIYDTARLFHAVWRRNLLLLDQEAGPAWGDLSREQRSAWHTVVFMMLEIEGKDAALPSKILANYEWPGALDGPDHPSRRT